MRKGYHLYFEGMVQGVGFRFSAVSLARRYNIKGWAANLADGRVEIMAEGRIKDLEAFLSALKDEFKVNISDHQLEELPFRGEYKSFEMRF